MSYRNCAALSGEQMFSLATCSFRRMPRLASIAPLSLNHTACGCTRRGAVVAPKVVVNTIGFGAMIEFGCRPLPFGHLTLDTATMGLVSGGASQRPSGLRPKRFRFI